MRALLQQALDAIVDLVPDPETDFGPMYEYAKKQQKLAIQALRTELAKPEPEPVAWMMSSAMDDFKRGFIVEVSRQQDEPDDIPLFTKEQL